MKILLLGEYSHVHWTLAEGLRQIGHQVTVVSDGDGWKDYPRDIDLKRRSASKWNGVRYLYDVVRNLPKLRGFDIVQLINPVFFELKGERMLPFYRYIRRNNGNVFMGAFGMDYFWVKAGLDRQTFRYSDFNIGAELRRNAYNDTVIADWLHGAKGRLNRLIADDCDGIVSGLYEYDASYRPYFADKLTYIPFPINPEKVEPIRPRTDQRLRLFIGIQKERSAYKGTDIMLKALLRLQQDFPEKCLIHKAESVPFIAYQKMLSDSDVLLDQLYSYTPAMNALMAMAKGMIVVGGGEEENYQILQEMQLRPIINVLPNEEDVYRKLKGLLSMTDEQIAGLQRDSIAYVHKHHHYIKVAQRYLDFWQSVSHRPERQTPGAPPSP